jgi:hypothetical protein
MKCPHCEEDPGLPSVGSGVVAWVVVVIVLILLAIFW